MKSFFTFVILFTWVYYSSMILYLEAEFTKVYAMEFGEGITPASYTVLVKQIKVEPTQNNVDTIVK